MIKKLIVNADDYGHTRGISQGIRRAHLQGIVTSTTAMMNRPAAAEELRQALNLCPDLGIGLHLVLTSGVPVLPAGVIPSLTKPDGSFHRLDGFLEHLPALDLDQVDAEWHAQVEKFIAVTGRAPDHLDSHHHSSYFTPALFERMLRLAEKLHCPMRKPFPEGSTAGLDYLPSHLVGAPGYGYSDKQGLRLARTTDRFIAAFCDAGATLPNLKKLLHEIINDPLCETFELMCHPAVVDAELMAVSGYNAKRGDELEILTSAEVRDLIVQSGIKLINYRKL